MFSGRDLLVLKLHHVALTIDLGKSAPFYAAVLPLLGYAREYGGDSLQVWKGTAPSPEVLLYAIEGEDSRPHTHGRPGGSTSLSNSRAATSSPESTKRSSRPGFPSSTNPALSRQMPCRFRFVSCSEG